MTRRLFRALIDAADVPDDVVGFHVQQAIEKRLKAVLSTRGVDYPFTHDLRRLCSLLEEAGVDLPAAPAVLDAYTPFAAVTRYEFPLDLPSLDRSEAAALVEQMRLWTDGQIAGR